MGRQVIELKSIVGIKDSESFKFELLKKDNSIITFTSPIVGDFYRTVRQWLKENIPSSELDVSQYEDEPFYSYDTTKDTISKALRQWEASHSTEGLSHYMMMITE